MVGTSPLGFFLRYSGVFTTPKEAPASTRLYWSPISSQHQSAFCTLTELFLPQITSMACSRNGGFYRPYSSCLRTRVETRSVPGAARAASDRLPLLLVGADDDRLREDVSPYRFLQRGLVRTPEIAQHGVERVELVKVAVAPDRRARTAIAGALPIVGAFAHTGR